ncbi:MAG: AmmeMemoRadiSam system protein B, partial [Verrucomicrobiota bacterium]
DDETETRRKDKLALSQIESGNPRGLYDICRSEPISMCGMVPAVAVMRALDSRPAELIKYETSAKFSGNTSRVVGYGGAIWW